MCKDIKGAEHVAEHVEQDGSKIIPFECEWVKKHACTTANLSASPTAAEIDGLVEPASQLAATHAPKEVESIPFSNSKATHMRTWKEKLKY